jgi:imidazole glycerol-phosphate synthase subunit HisH
MLNHVNLPWNVASSSEEVMKATHLILPGVGAFDFVMRSLKQSGLIPALNRFALEEKRPVLGVCVGMQVMFESSEEGVLNGLGWFEGKVRHLSKIYNVSSQSLRTPHMGWNALNFDQTSPMFSNLCGIQEFYFLHSYYCHPYDDDVVIATADYGASFCAVAQSNNIIGIQCHPEKSHACGANFLKVFSEI